MPDQSIPRLTRADIAAPPAIHPQDLEQGRENSLAIEIRHPVIPFEHQTRLAFPPRGDAVGQHRLNPFVADALVVTLQAIAACQPVRSATVQPQIRTARRTTGLFPDLGIPTQQAKRALHEFAAGTPR